MTWLFCSLSLHYHLQFFHKHEQTARFSRFIPTSLACLHLSVYRRPIDNVDLNNGLKIPGTRYRLLLFRLLLRSSVVRFQRARRHATLDLPRFFISAMTCYAKQNWNSSQCLGREFTAHIASCISYDMSMPTSHIDQLSWCQMDHNCII